jgi:hypothetical protein
MFCCQCWLRMLFFDIVIKSPKQSLETYCFCISCTSCPKCRRIFDYYEVGQLFTWIFPFKYPVYTLIRYANKHRFFPLKLCFARIFDYQPYSMIRYSNSWLLYFYLTSYVLNFIMLVLFFTFKFTWINFNVIDNFTKF